MKFLIKLVAFVLLTVSYYFMALLKVPIWQGVVIGTLAYSAGLLWAIAGNIRE